MIGDENRKQLQNIIRGNVTQGQIDHCTTIKNLLVESFGTGPTVKSEFESRSILKEEQTEFLALHAKKSGLLLKSLPFGSEYLTRGGEAEIYLSADKMNVIKVNDGIYYATWTEYFTSIAIHNLLFPNTVYTLLGFIEQESSVRIVLQQPFVEGEQAKLKDIKELLTFNGFVNTRRQDYYHNEFRLLLEDMHDENVIAKENVLFFVDTVFYVV